jgi:hypothetical protein
VTSEDYAMRVLEEIENQREVYPDNRETEAYISGLKKGLALHMGTAASRQFLSDRGENSN